MEINTKDYGFIAFLIYKYDAKKIKNGVKIIATFDKIDLIKEYEQSGFSVYNKILKEVVRS